MTVSCSSCGLTFRIPDTDGFSHCDNHSDWQAEDE